jgi:acyl-CoA thioesterase
MEEKAKKAFITKASEEPFAKLVGLRLLDVGEGYAVCEMEYTEIMDNIHGMAHGGAIFSLIDEAFEISSNSYGTMAVALSMNVTYIRPATKYTILTAESRELSKGNKTSTYQITVRDAEGLLAVCQALAYRKKESLAFLE